MTDTRLYGKVTGWLSPSWMRPILPLSEYSVVLIVGGRPRCQPTMALPLILPCQSMSFGKNTANKDVSKFCTAKLTWPLAGEAIKFSRKHSLPVWSVACQQWAASCTFKSVELLPCFLGKLTINCAGCSWFNVAYFDLIRPLPITPDQLSLSRLKPPLSRAAIASSSFATSILTTCACSVPLKVALTFLKLWPAASKPSALIISWLGLLAKLTSLPRIRPWRKIKPGSASRSPTKSI